MRIAGLFGISFKDLCGFNEYISPEELESLKRIHRLSGRGLSGEYGRLCEDEERQKLLLDRYWNEKTARYTEETEDLTPLTEEDEADSGMQPEECIERAKTVRPCKQDYRTVLDLTECEQVAQKVGMKLDEFINDILSRAMHTALEEEYQAWLKERGSYLDRNTPFLQSVFATVLSDVPEHELRAADYSIYLDMKMCRIVATVMRTDVHTLIMRILNKAMLCSIVRP